MIVVTVEHTEQKEAFEDMAFALLTAKETIEKCYAFIVFGAVNGPLVDSIWCLPVNNCNKNLALWYDGPT